MLEELFFEIHIEGIFVTELIYFSSYRKMLDLKMPLLMKAMVLIILNLSN